MQLQNKCQVAGQRILRSHLDKQLRPIAVLFLYDMIPDMQLLRYYVNPLFQMIGFNCTDTCFVCLCWWQLVAVVRVEMPHDESETQFCVVLFIVRACLLWLVISCSTRLTAAVWFFYIFITKLKDIRRFAQLIFMSHCIVTQFQKLWIYFNFSKPAVKHCKAWSIVFCDQHSFRSLSHDMSTASSKASSSHSGIWCFLFPFPVSSRFLQVIQ
jgi:hypothetical protein